jgi:signal transduction histidine kinase
MKSPTMVSRVAWTQALLTGTALSIVVLATSLALRAMFTAKADGALQDLLRPIVAYLDQGPDHAPIDWQLLTAEIEEHRPSDTRVEVRSRWQTAAPLLALGHGGPLDRSELGCGDHDTFRVCAVAGRKHVVFAAKDRTEEAADRNILMATLLVACALTAATVAASSRWLSRRTLKPLSDLAARVDAIVPGSEHSLAVSSRVREVAVLEERFADLLRRFEEALAREKRFGAQASHELRTPLTVARAEIESLASEPSGRQNQTRALAALARLEQLIETLLWFARAQVRLDGEDMEIVNVADIARAQIAELQKTVCDRAFAVELPDEALVRGDEHLLGRAIANLIGNAVKHGAGSAIEVRAGQEPGWAVLTFANAGRGIPESQREAVFEPFYRGETTSDGFGLGLPFARAVVRAHGGDIHIAGGPERTEVHMRLPVVPWNEQS